jgi:hypothetical protein
MNVDSLPADLAGYENFVPHHGRQSKTGGVAIKFELHFRAFIFRSATRKAESIYAKYHPGGVPSAEDYRLFQDYIFRVMIDQADKLKLPMHFHTAVGIGDYFSLAGAISNLETSFAMRAARHRLRPGSVAGLMNAERAPDCREKCLP